MLYINLLPQRYDDHLHRMNQQMSQMKLVYYKYLVKYNKDTQYQNALEIYEASKQLQKAIKNYQKYQNSAQMKEELGTYLINILQQETKV